MGTLGTIAEVLNDRRLAQHDWSLIEYSWCADAVLLGLSPT